VAAVSAGMATVTVVAVDVAAVAVTAVPPGGGVNVTTPPVVPKPEPVRVMLAGSAPWVPAVGLRTVMTAPVGVPPTV